ncbi:MAG: flagellar biosynthesis protein FlhB [Spirochaetes bacterium]|nr:flagellar biosynthesis protein FlhB [Spirochaetota bacterium]
MNAEIVYWKSHPWVSEPRGELCGYSFNLQLFAAEDEGRTEEPTEKKLREAREKGQVAKTHELAPAAVLLFSFIVIVFLAAWMYDIFARMTKYYMSSFSRFSLTQTTLIREFIRISIESAKVLAPIFAAAVVAAFLGNVIQVGFQFSAHPMRFDLSKLRFDPATVMKRVFFSRQIAMNFVKTIFKVVAIGFVAYLVIVNDYDDIVRTPDVSVTSALLIISMTSVKVILFSALVLLFLSIPDYFFQKREFIESLKMTKQELKEEWKETIGDPHVRARLREMQREIVMKNMIREVPKADVVITNPTHYAAALKYDSNTMEAPQLIAKGIDSMALRIREIAKQHNVYIVENRPLAQELCKRLEVGDFIPPDLFYAVSLIYSELYRMGRFDFKRAM